MSVAIFQCVNNNVAVGIQRIFSTTPIPAAIYGTGRSGKFTSMTFQGDCVAMYSWGLSFAEQSSKSVAFIGIDEKADAFVDELRLMLLSSMPCGRLQRAPEHRLYYSLLEKNFAKAIGKGRLSDEWLTRICNQCAIGQDIGGGNAAGQVFSLIQLCQAYGVDTDMLEGEVGYTTAGSTLVRVMGHICYLYGEVNGRRC